MPGGISLFLMWFAPSIAMVLGVVIGVTIYKQGVKRAGRTAFNGFRRVFFKKSYRNYLRNLERQYSKELSTNRNLGKRFAKGYHRIRPNMAQRALQKFHIRRYEPKELSPRAQEWRKKRLRNIQNYLKKTDSSYNESFYDAQFHENTRSSASINQDISYQYQNKKQYTKSPRISSIALDQSTLSTSSEETARKFARMTSRSSFKEKAQETKNSSLYNRMFVTTSDGKELPLESFISKDKETFYTISDDIFKHMINNVPEDVYPVKVAQTIVKNNIEVREQRLYSKQELIELEKQYEKQSRFYKKTYSEEYNSEFNR